VNVAPQISLVFMHCCLVACGRH